MLGNAACHSRSAARRRAGAVLAAALLVAAGAALPARAAEKVKIAVGGESCVCYLPTILTRELGYYKEAGLDVELIDFKGGSTALTAVLGGSADVVSGFYDHTVELAAKHKAMQSIVIFDKLPGLVLTVSPKETANIKTLADLVGKHVGVSAPGSSTDFFLKYLLRKNGLDPNKVAVVGIGNGAPSIAAMEQDQVQAGVLVEPAVTELQSRHPDLRILSDTRTEAETQKVFGGDYPAGALYTQTSWVEAHKDAAQRLADAIVHTLVWIKGHTPEEIMAKMPKAFTSSDPKTYLAALKNMLPTYSTTGLMDPKGAEAVLAVFSESVPEIKNAHIDVTKTYTNEFAKKADAKFGAKS
ncbi:MAG TPA: ABC transporter substrate-binding protein [Stellaceae bacterium]|nr:ABC transporter substrate-binding protein [Stellaceae bacterium]